MKKCLFIFLLASSIFMLASCGKKQPKEKEEAQTRASVTKVQPSSNSREKSMSDKLFFAEEFMTTYINQSFDLTGLKDKQERLEELSGDGSLEEAIRSIVALQAELLEYQETKQISTSASVTLVEREISSLTLYQNGALFFADVSYSENSPAFSGSFDRRRQFTFKIEDDKIINFEEVIYK